MAGIFGRSEISGATPESSTTIHGWPSVIFGIPFLTVGVVVFLVSIKVIPSDPKSIHAPMWVLSAAGAMFGLPGFFLMIHGARGLSRKTRLKMGREQRPDKPWMWDYDWEPLGITENKIKSVMNHFMAAIFFTVFLLPFNWWAFMSDKGGAMVIGIVGLFDLIMLAVWQQAIRKLLQYRKYGNSRLRFGDFPLYLGEKARLTLEGLPPQIEKLEFKLRAVEEAYEMRGSGKNRSQKVICYERYGEERVLENVTAGNGQFKMDWDLPENKELASRFSDRPAFFWEIVIDAQTPGIDYHARFPLPVYAKP